jgi:hypothetical protein
MSPVENVHSRDLWNVCRLLSQTSCITSLRVAAGASSSSGFRRHRFQFNWSHGSEAFLFLWFTIVTRDGRFLAPTGYPARQDVQELPKITSRHVSLLPSTTFIFRRTRIHSLINCLSHTQLSHFSCTTSTKRPMFQEVMFLRLSCLYLMGIEIDFNEGNHVIFYSHTYDCQYTIARKYNFITEEIAAVSDLR